MQVNVFTSEANRDTTRGFLRGMTPMAWWAASILMLASLRNFHFAAAGGAVFSLSSALVLGILLAGKVARSADRAKPKMSAWVAFVAFASVAFISAMMFPNPEDIKKSAGLFIGGFCLLATAIIFRDRWRDFRAGLSTVICVHLIFLVAQILVYFAFGHYLDYVSISDDHSRWLSGKGFFVGDIPIPRFTGLYAEPGTYSGSMGLLLAARFALRPSIDRIMVLGTLTLFATASLTGYVLGAGLVCAMAISYVITCSRRVKFMAFGLAALIGAPAALFAVSRLTSRLSHGGADGRAASGNLSWLLSSEGFTWLGRPIYSLPDFVSVDYFGLLSAMYNTFGLIGALALLFPLTEVLMTSPALAVVILLAKAQVTYPLAFIIIAAVAFGRNQVDRRRH